MRGTNARREGEETMLTGMPDFTGTVKCPERFTNAKEAIRGLKKARAKSIAGDLGAIILWYDDNGFYRGERDVYRVTASEIKVKTAKELLPWLREELPKIKEAQ